MQSVLDSFCRCLGTAHGGSHPHHDDEEHVMGATDGTSGSPDARSRRMNRLGLQDKQWDALFNTTQQRGVVANRRQQQQEQSKSNNNTNSNTSTGNNNNSNGGKTNNSGQKQGQPAAHDALAKAKLAANPSRYKANKRKRSLKGRDDIFRQRNRQTFESVANSAATSAGCGITHNGDSSSFSRLANHPAVVNALCFATPINEDFDNHDNHSLTSDTNTLNTCEDTINSMFYLESTQLANIVENRPPMPLFSQFQVKDSPISNIIATDSHSSLKLLYNDQNHPNAAPMAMTTTRSTPTSTVSQPPPPTATRSSSNVIRHNLQKPLQSSTPHNGQRHQQKRRQRQQHQHQQHHHPQQHQQPRQQQRRQFPLTVSSSDDDMPPQVSTSSGSDASSRRV